MKNIFFVNFLILGLILNIKSQNFTISGVIKDSLSHENLVDVTIIDLKNNRIYKSNEYGYFSITLPENQHQLLFTYSGYNSKIIEFNLTQNIVKEIELNKQNIELQQIVVKGTKNKSNIENLSLSRIQKMPSLAGETDVLKSLIQVPGVNAGSEGSAGLNVRGGSPDQNLFLLDDIPVYNVNHVFGFISVFNTDAIKSVKLYKGGIPSEYTGKSSAVVDMYMKEGDLQKFHGDFSIGIISSKILIEGPIKKDKSSFIITARRSYIDLLFRPFSKSLADNTITGFYFFDFNTKVNYKLNDKNRFFLSFYSGKDNFYVKYNESEKVTTNLLQYANQSISWGNATASLRWLSIINIKTTLNTSIFFTRFDYISSNSELNESIIDNEKIKKEYFYKSGSGIEELGFKSKLNLFLDQIQTIRLGISCSRMFFEPNFTSEYFNDEYTDLNKSLETNFSEIIANSFTSYAENQLIFNKIGLNLGVNFNGFYVNRKLYYFLEPRANIWYKPNGSVQLELSYTNIHQYLHLLTNSTIGLPTDLWVPTTDKQKPINSNIYDAGISVDLNKIRFSVSGFYKTFDNLIQYMQGVDFLDVKTDWQEKITKGRGWSYGCEISVQKDEGQFLWQMSYTYSRSYRVFEKLNSGKVFFYKYDRPHNFNFQIEYKLKPNILFTTNWIIMSGHMATYATTYYLSNDRFPRPFIESLNNIRFPIYHRLDLGFNITKIRKKSIRIWSWGIYNAYNRLNPLYLQPSVNSDKLEGVSYSPIMPFVNYSIKF